MKTKLISISVRFAPLLAVVLAATPLEASVLWNESINGDLSNSGSSPTALTLASGVNAVIGTVGGTDQQDWLALTVPVGMQLSSLILESYSSTDMQGFTGVQSGSNFVGSVNSAGSYLGYAHFGTGAANGPLAATNLVGSDLLPLMGNTTDAAGSHGFTPPLASGEYVFLIQQLGASTSYEFDYDVTVVPEPASAALTALGCGLILFRRWRARAGMARVGA